MNKKTTYEVLIAEKVTQLTVPDMADAIWAKIELGLNATPGAEGADQQVPSENLPTNAMTVTTKVWLTIITVAAIAVLIILFTKNNRKEKPARSKELPATTQERERKQEKDPVTEEIKDTTVTKADEPFQKVVSKKDTSGKNTVIPIFNIPVLNAPLKSNRNDSGILVNIPPAIARPDSTAPLVPPLKKSRGVKGIGDGNYKIISGKKDSL